MALQADVAFAQAGVVGGDRVVRHQLAVECHIDRGVGGLDFEGIPLTGRLGAICEDGARA